MIAVMRIWAMCSPMARNQPAFAIALILRHSILLMTLVISGTPRPLDGPLDGKGWVPA